MARFLEDVEKHFDEARARSKQRRAQEQMEKSRREAEKAAKKNKPGLFL